MRYLALLMLAPWLLILGWAYWAYPKSLPRNPGRRIFDAAALLLAAFAAVQAALLGFGIAGVPSVGGFGRSSGAIWQQVLPALNGYGAYVVVLLVAMVMRYAIWRHRAR